MTTKAKEKKPKAAKKATRDTTTPAAPTVAESMPLTALDLTVAKGVRAAVDEEAVGRYRDRYAAKEAMPPLECTATRGQPETPVWVGDGGHRALAMIAAGRSSADCLVWWYDTPEEAEAKAWEIAYAGNTSHGLPRGTADLRAAVRTALLREPPASSDRELAEKLRCHRGVVVRVRYDMTEEGKLAGKARFDQRKYKESEYAAWKLGTGKRPTAGPVAPPESPAARPPDSEVGWRGVSVKDADLGTAAEAQLAAIGVTTIGQVADLLDRDSPMPGKLESKRTDMQEVVDAVRADGVVTGSERVPSPVDPVEKTTTTRPSVVRDEKGRPVPDLLIPVFQARTQFRSLTQRYGALFAEVEALSQSPGGDAIQTNPMKAYSNDLSRGVAGGMPYVVCPGCGGAGIQAGQACPQCVGTAGDKVGRGWVCRLRYDQFDPAVKKKCEGPWEPDTTE